MANVIKLMSNVFRTTAITRQQIYLRFSSNTSVSKDLIRTLPKEANTLHTHDILLGTLKTATTTNNVLDLVKSHVVVMNNKHLIQALRSLFTLQKGGHSSLSTQEILKHPDFKLLCNNLKKHAGAIELNETIEALKVVCYVGVTSDSTIVQVLLQLLRHQVNYLSLQQIIFLDFLLNQLRTTPLIEALQLALPIIFEIQLQIKVDRENIQQLAECLFFATKKNVSEKCIEFLINEIVRYQGESHTKTTMSLLWSVCDLKSDKYFEPLVKKLVDDMIVDIDSLSYGDLETTLSKMTTSYSVRHKFYYSDVLCDLIANYVIDNDLGHEAAIYVLKRFNKLSHTNDPLLNYVSEKFNESEQVFHETNPLILCHYISALSLTNYRPVHWERIKMLIAKTNKFKNLQKEVIWLRLAANLCTLNIYKMDVFEMAFRESYIKKILKTNHITDFDNLIQLKQAIMTYKPDLEEILPAKYLIERAVNKLRPPSDLPLEGALLNVFGGDKYVKNGVTTSLHHQIDHLVVLRKGGFPVAFATSTAPNTIEELQLTDDTQMLAIMALGPHHFTLNSKRLRSGTALSLRTLEKKGVLVVAVNVDNWQQLADFERIPYLMRLVKNKTNANELVSNVNV